LPEPSFLPRENSFIFKSLNYVYFEIFFIFEKEAAVEKLYLNFGLFKKFI
jgi:hypothetical protein